MKNLAERLTWARLASGLTQQQLADAAGVAQSTIGSLESGARSTARKIAVIALALSVDPLWLAEGKGMARVPVPGGVRPGSTRDGEMLESENSSIVMIPKVMLKLSAGITGFTVEDGEDDGRFPLEQSFILAHKLVPGNLMAIKVKGESMEPSLYAGDTVVINSADSQPADGEVFAVNYEGEPVVKRMTRDAGNWWLSSDNPDQRKYHRKVCSGEACIVIGRVVLKISQHI